MQKRSLFSSSIAALLVFGSAEQARAGVDQCNGIRLQDAGNCEIVVSGDCDIECEELGIYEKACATKLVTVCNDQCTFSADATCTDECTVPCKEGCDNGVNVICSHNCFVECTTTRDVDCSSATDPEQCAATWDANCDAECDSQCVTVDGGCYQHCIECCGGSCTADANMDCQQVCQEEQFEECEYELRADCSGSCSGEGALFCDGEYILSGSQMAACIEALIAEGIGNLEAEGGISVGPDGIEADGSAGFCTAAPRPSGPFGALPAAATAALVGLWARRRRARRP